MLSEKFQTTLDKKILFNGFLTILGKKSVEMVS